MVRRLAAFLGGAFLLLLFPYVRWAKLPFEQRVFVPQTPMDRTSGQYAEEWLFLRLASGSVPRGATYGVRAAHLRREMSLHMIALGLLPASRPIPASYWDQPLDEPSGERPAFLLVFRCERPPGEGYRLVQGVLGSCVYAREGPP